MVPSAPVGEAAPPTASPWSEPTTLAVGAIAGVAAFAAGMAGCAPTGARSADVVLTALFAAAVVGLGARARPLPLVLAAAIALVAGTDPGLWALAAVAVAGAVALAVARGRGRSPREGSTGGFDHLALLAALVTGLTVEVLLRLPTEEPARLTALIAGVAVVPVIVSGWRGSAIRSMDMARRGLVGALVAVGAAGAAGLVAVVLAGSSLRSGVDRSEEGLDAVRAGEQEQAGANLRAAEGDLRHARAVTRAWWVAPARHLPLVAPQLTALDAMADGGAETAGLAADAADRIDAEGLELVDGRLDPAAVAAVAPVLDEVAEGTARVSLRLGRDRAASGWQVAPIADGFATFRDELAAAEGSARTAALAATVGPELLGADGQARYFVAFVTPSEARGTGFLGSYGMLTATDGEIDLPTVGRNKDLNAGGAPEKEITGPPDYLARYSRFEPESAWENVTFTPDGPTAAEVMAELYPQSGGEEVDGVLRIDPVGVARLLRVTGPVTVPGLPFSLDATNVEQFLLVGQYQLYPDRDARIDVLGDVASTVFDALTEGEGVAPARLAQALGPAVRGDHLTLWLRSKEGTELVDRLGLSGAVPAVAGDGFGVVTENAAGNKVDSFLQRTIRYRAEVDTTTGRVRATAEIGLVNSAPTSGEPPYIIGNLIDAPSGTNRMYLSAYSPLDLVSAEVDGAPVTLERGRELGRNVWSAFVDVPAGASATVTLELEGEVDLSIGRYRFDLLPQAMARPDRASVEVAVTGGRVDGATTTALDEEGTELDADVGEDGAVRVEVPAVQGSFSVSAAVARDPG